MMLMGELNISEGAMIERHRNVEKLSNPSS
jgi:hypothetical protein